MDWKPIETAPKDGTVIWARRIYDGRVIAEGEAEWGVAADGAQIRQPIERDPLNRFSAEYYVSEAQAMAATAARERWMRKGRMYAFPEPTEWMQLSERPE